MKELLLMLYIRAAARISCSHFNHGERRFRNIHDAETPSQLRLRLWLWRSRSL